MIGNIDEIEKIAGYISAYIGILIPLTGVYLFLTGKALFKMASKNVSNKKIS